MTTTEFFRQMPKALPALYVLINVFNTDIIKQLLQGFDLNTPPNTDIQAIAAEEICGKRKESVCVCDNFSYILSKLGIFSQSLSVISNNERQ